LPTRTNYLGVHSSKESYNSIDHVLSLPKARRFFHFALVFPWASFQPDAPSAQRAYLAELMLPHFTVCGGCSFCLFSVLHVRADPYNAMCGDYKL
jgi:hypothetical protein